MDKPNQIINEIREVIYPPSTAVAPQLQAIKTIAASAARVYEATEDIHTVLPNLDSIQNILDYLKGMPITDDFNPAPEDKLNPVYKLSTSDVTIYSSFDKNGEYNVTIVGIDVEPKISSPELFGDIDFNAFEMQIEIPVICGNKYTVTQSNPILEHYKNDKNIFVDPIDGNWEKVKDYYMDEDEFTYAFLIGEGRNNITIEFYDTNRQESFVFNITSHIHFKKQEVDENEQG